MKNRKIPTYLNEDDMLQIVNNSNIHWSFEKFMNFGDFKIIGNGDNEGVKFDIVLTISTYQNKYIFTSLVLSHHNEYVSRCLYDFHTNKELDDAINKIIDTIIDYTIEQTQRVAKHITNYTKA